MGVVDSDLQYLKVGSIVHSRWLTLGCPILRYYVSVDEPSSNLETLTKFCLQVYFPSWFEIKLNSQLTCGSRNFFNLVQRVLQVPDEAVRKTALKVVQRNAFFAHQENVLMAMLGDNDEEISQNVSNIATTCLLLMIQRSSLVQKTIIYYFKKEIKNSKTLTTG